MTKKDFELIASVIKPLKIDFKGFIASCFADTLASKNPRFDKEKFLKACGVEVLPYGNENITCNFCAGLTGKEREQLKHECYEIK